MDIQNGYSMSNSAENGYGGYAYLSNCQMFLNSTRISNSNALKGGAIYAINSEVRVYDIATMTNNAAKLGGAIYIEGIRGNVTFFSSNFFSNEAKESGGAIYCEDHSNISVYNAHFRSNFAEIGYGGYAYLSNCHMSFIGRECTISNNTAPEGGAIYAEKSEINVYSAVTLAENTAKESGGAIYLIESIIILHDETLKFDHNVVTSKNGKGGAFFVMDNFISCDPVSCFLNIIRNSENAYHVSRLLVFQNNSASQGPVIYGGLLDRCEIYQNYYPLKINCVKISSPASMSIASNPVRVCLCNSDHTVNCTTRELTTTISRGEAFDLEVAVVDQDQNPKASVIIAEYKETEANLGELESKNKVNKTCTKLSYHVLTSSTTATLSLQLQEHCNFSSITVHVSVRNCTRGLHTDKDNYRCECEERLQEFVTDCEVDTLHVQRGKHIWLSYNEECLKVHINCPRDYCNFTSSAISLQHPDEQCANNRRGVACGA